MSGADGYVATWDGSLSSTIAALRLTKLRRRMVGADRNVVVDIPGRDGGWVFSERRGFRQITAECVVVAPPGGARHDAVVAVADWLDKTGERKLIFDDQPDRYWLATLRDDPDPDEWRSTGRFSVNWSAQPYAYAVATSSQALTATAVSGTSGTFTPADTIDAYPVVEVTPLDGTMTALTLTMNGDSLSWSGSPIYALATLTISSVSYTVTRGASTDTELTGAFVAANVDMADVSGEFPMIVVGGNSWAASWSGTATRLRITITWRRRYR